MNRRAEKVYVHGDSSKNEVLLDPAALRSRLVAKAVYEQKTCDDNAKDGDANRCPKEVHQLTPVGTVSLGGCGPHYKFAVKNASGVPLKHPAQLKSKLTFADQTNGWVDFRNLGGGYVAIDPASAAPASRAGARGRAGASSRFAASHEPSTAPPSRLAPRAATLFLAARHFGGERIEPRLPEATELTEPGIDLRQGARVDGIQASRALGAHAREAVVAQHFELLRHRGLGDAELLRDHLHDLARGVLAEGQELQDATPNRITQDVEGVHQPPV